jgi:hypothetical protein
MALTWKKPWNKGGDAPRVDCECVCLLNIPRYIFIVQRLSILSKLDSNNPYRIWVELYFLNLNYLIILDTWPIWPSRRPRRSRFTCWSYLSFGPILFTTHLLVWPSYGDNTTTRAIRTQDRGAKKFESLKDFDVCDVHKKEPWAQRKRSSNPIGKVICRKQKIKMEILHDRVIKVSIWLAPAFSR